MHASRGETHLLEKKLGPKALHKPELRDIEEALLVSVKEGYNSCIPILVVAGARRLDCALYLAIQLEQIESIAILLLCKSTIVGDCAAIRSLLSEPPESDHVPWYMPKVHHALAKGAIKMSYPIAVSIMEKNYESTKELLLKTDLDMGQKRVDWSKLKLTLLHSSWMYSIAPWVVSLKLVNNHLRKLPNELFQAMQLRRLDLSQNLLETVQADILALPNLEYLCLAHNRLREIPDTTNWTPSLLTLDLSENHLTTLPVGIQYSAVEILNLSKNQFTTVPKCLCRIRTLTSLDLSYMPVSSWPKEMENLDKLVNLNLSNTSIADLPRGDGVIRGGLRGVLKARARSSKPCNYIKLILLCHSDTVKGVMLSRLKPHFSAQAPMPDIDIFQWSYRPLFTRSKLFFGTTKLHFNTWIVGSTFECSSLYPCLFTSSALNVIVWDLTKTADMREQIKTYVDLLVRHVPQANVLVIAILPESFESWADANSETLAKRLNTFFHTPYYKSLRYHGMVLVVASPNVKEGQSDMKQRLYDVAMAMTINNQQLVTRQFPENYYSLIPALEKEQKSFSARSQPGILEETALWNMFQQALSSDPPDIMELPVIVDFLQETGFLLHFEDPNDHLDQYYFTRPVWLYHALLRVLHHSLEHPSRLIVSVTELASLTNVNWNQDATAALIRLMIRFAIIVPTKPNQFLITCLLPHCNLNATELFCGNLRRQFAPKVKALPSDLWSRLVGLVLFNLPRIVNVQGKRRHRTSEGAQSPLEFDENLEVTNDNTDEETDKQDTSVVRNSRLPSVDSEPRLDSPSLRPHSSSSKESLPTTPLSCVQSPLSKGSYDGEPTSFARLHIAKQSYIEESDDEMLITPSEDKVVELTGRNRDSQALTASQESKTSSTGLLTPEFPSDKQLSNGSQTSPRHEAEEPTSTSDQDQKIEASDQNLKIEASEQDQKMKDSDQSQKIKNSDRSEKIESSEQSQKIESSEQSQKIESSDKDQKSEDPFPSSDQKKESIGREHYLTIEKSQEVDETKTTYGENITKENPLVSSESSSEVPQPPPTTLSVNTDIPQNGQDISSPDTPPQSFPAHSSALPPNTSKASPHESSGEVEKQVTTEHKTRPKFRKQLTVGSNTRRSQFADGGRHQTLPETVIRPRLHRNVSAPPRKRETRSRSQIDPARIDNTLIWDTGVVYRDKNVQFSIYPCLCEVSSVEERGIEVCSTRDNIGRIVLARVCRLIQKLLEERFPELFSVDLHLQKHELTQLAICPVCLEKNERNPTSFLVEACVHALEDSVQHNCRYHPESVPIQDMVPDYLMTDLPRFLRLKASQFTMDEIKPLHRGRSTRLHHGTFNGIAVAVKVYQHVEGKSITLPLSFVRQDMEMLSTLNHPNIVSAFGFCLQPPCVILEKAPLGNLYEKLMDTDQKISRMIRFHICCQVTSALNYLHKNDIIYRTLKASSILVWSLDFVNEVNVKLANFERAAYKSPSGLLGKMNFASYPAPEMLRYSYREEYSEKVDIYSFGILLYEIVTRWQPFSGIYNTDRLPSSQRPKLAGGVTTGYSTLVRLMEDCWQEDPCLRPSASSLVKRLSLPSFQCHLATQVLRDCISVRGCCFVPSVRQIWVYGEYNKTSTDGDGELFEGTQVFILNADNLTVQGSLELRERASSILAVDSKVWIGMTEACVHAYDCTTFNFTDRLHLNDSVTCIANNDTYVFVAQANGHLKCYHKLMLPKDKALDIEIGDKVIIAMLTVGDIIWLSCGNELVILDTEDEITVEARWDACDPNEQIYALVLSKDATIIWSLVRGELAITSWNVHTGKKKHSVDLSEELNWICCEINYDPTYLRLVSLECVGDTLWLGLTCGVIVILTADEEPKVITNFRAHRSAPKCLLDIPRQGSQVLQDTHVVLSGGFGDIISSSNASSEQNGVIISWQALTTDQFRLVTRRHKEHHRLT